MSSLQAAEAAVNAHGGNAVDVSPNQPDATPAPSHSSPPAELPPCPECRGELLRYQNHETDEDELLCLDCWWSVPTAAFIPPADGTNPHRHDGIPV